jgi:hypothetical protein
MRQRQRIDFAEINAAARPLVAAIVLRLLPGGRVEGHEYVVRNPTRADRRAGSFRVNLRTGRWGDFACNDKGGDVISLTAYVTGSSQLEAAKCVADLINYDFGAVRRA